MSTIDLVLLIIILLSAVMGLMRGLFKEVFSLLILFGAFLLATYFAPALAAALATQVGSSSFGYGVAFGLLFAGTLIAGGILSYLAGKALTSSGLSGTDRFFGFIFGALRGGLICLVGLIAVRSFFETTDWWNASEIAPMLLEFEDVALDWLGRAGQAVGDIREAAKPPSQ